MTMMKMLRFAVPLVLMGALSLSAYQPQGKGKKADQKQSDKDKSKDKDKAAEPKKDDAPKPLFEGNLGIKSSRQGKDSAALGFNGLDPEGKIEKAALNSPVLKTDMLNAMAIAAYSPTNDELQKFMAEGNLKAGPGPQQQAQDKKKK